MTLSRERRAFDLYQEAFDLAPGERAAFLEAAYSKNPELRTEVEGLFRAHVEMGEFLDLPAAEAVSRAAAARVPEIATGAEVGAYRVIRRLGRGASGSVYEAEQARPQRRVALKVLRAGFASATARRRFVDEAQVLARLDHAGIARIFEAGMHRTQGVEVPFFALELVEGARPITLHAAEVRLGARARVALMADACDAVHHGHQMGVLHRDVKPANLLVDGRGRVKVIDFGIAREVAARDESALFAGTLAYMSPEQADPGSTGPGKAHLDVRSDVYALGAVLHELLTGRLPHDVEGLSLAEAVRRIRTEPPASPGPGVHRDLVAITMKATATRRENRYASAAALGEDLRRHLDHRAVEATAGGALYHVAKFARRQPLAFSALSAVLLLSVAAALGGTRLAGEKERERNAAEFQAYVANVAAASSALRLHDVAGARTHLDRAPERLRNWEWYHLAGQLDTSEATWRWPGHMILAGAVDPSGGRIVACGAALAGGREFGYGLRAWDARTGEVVWTVAGGGRRADALAFVPDGSVLVAGHADGTVELRDAETGAIRTTLPAHSRSDRPRNETHVNAIVVDPAGRWIATGSGDRCIRFWELPSGRLTRTLGAHADRVICMALVPGGSRLVAGIRDGSIVVWDLASGRAERRIPAHESGVEGVAVSADGTRLVSVSRDETVRVWDLVGGGIVATASVHESNVRSVAFAPAGDRFATASWDRTVALFRASDGRQLARLSGHTDNVEEVAFLPGADRLVSFSRDGTVKTWRVDADHEVPAMRGHADFVWGVAAAGSGRYLVSVSGPYERRGYVWDLENRSIVAWFDRAEPFLPVVLVLPDASRFAVADRWKPVEVRSLPDALPLDAPSGMTGPIALDGARDLLYGVAPRGAGIAVWRTDPWASIGAWRAGGPVLALAVAPDGRKLVTGAEDGTVSLWDTVTHGLVSTARTGSRAPTQFAFDPSGTVLAVCDRGAVVHLLDAQNLAPVGSLAGHASEVNAVVFSPDGTRIATASQDATVRLWDAATRGPVAVLDARRHPVHCLTFADAGRTLVSSGGFGEVPGEIRLWTAPGLPSASSGRRVR